MRALAKELDDLTAGLGIVVMPVRVTPAADGADVDVGLDEMPLADFVRVAHRAGVRLLYRVAPEFDLKEFDESLPESVEEERQAERARLVRRARRHSGEIVEVEVAFAHEGVLHRWSITPSWYDSLIAEAGSLRAPASGDRSRPADRGEREVLEERLAGELAAMPSFRRRASTDHAARAAAYDHAEMVSLLDGPDPDWTVHHILRRARARVDMDAERLYHELTESLPQLAAELAVDEQFLASTRIVDRRNRAEDFLTEKYEGYRAPARFRDRLMNTPPLRAGKLPPQPSTLY
ncbi:hypothetical protein [Frankia sp. AiPa1]|uniref:hypothetical protein n=1 Tax=Frankia sp. AiPa1 TaxID=573492 RepID=UPI00202B3B16|nr:hypothetical protein [Frankia sp. AiPa1]MCL9762970.1 hypothetical protein [Frankia sp. AiPa1]